MNLSLSRDPRTAFEILSALVRFDVSNFPLILVRSETIFHWSWCGLEFHIHPVDFGPWIPESKDPCHPHIEHVTKVTKVIEIVN